MNLFNLPNTLTIARITLIPIFVTTLKCETYNYSLYIFVIAALSDLLDGQLARLRGQGSRFGRYLDPIADKFMLMTSYVFFAYNDWVPAWLAILIISRDVIILSGVLLLYLFTRKLIAEPTVLGKASTVMQFLLLFFILLNINYGILLDIIMVLIWVTALTTSVSGFQYMYKGLIVAGEK